MFEGAVRRTVASSGVELAVVEAGEVVRPAIVFIHGYPDTKELWDQVLEELAGDFHVAAYDVRGAGESSAPRGPAGYDLGRLGDDLLSVCDAVAPGRPVHIVGHDWGGIQAWEFVTTPRFEGRLLSFTTIAGPSLDQVAESGRELVRRGQLLSLLARARHSWYVVVQLIPGLPTLGWRLLLGPTRWRFFLERVDRVPVDDEHPASSLVSDALHGVNLYRRNIPPRMLRPRSDARAHVPVQVVIPSGDRFISDSYYERVAEHVPRLRVRRVEGSHWVPRTHPKLIARWVGEFVQEAEGGSGDGSGTDEGAARPWVRGGGREQLSGRLALVTGAASGIGLATAEALATCGSRVLLVDRDGDALSAAAEKIPDSRALTCDVADAEAMERMAVGVLEDHGTPQIVVNNAGIAIAGPFVYTDFEAWRRILDINLMGVVHGCRLFGRAMIVAGQGGQIVNTASAAAFAPAKSLPAYCSSKAAVLMLSECLRSEFAPWGIGVTAVCPGFIATNITRRATFVGRPAGEQEKLRTTITRLYERRGFGPERVAASVVEAIARDQAIAVVTPEAKAMRGLSRLAPGLMRRLGAIETLPV